MKSVFRRSKLYVCVCVRVHAFTLSNPQKATDNSENNSKIAESENYSNPH